MPPLPDNNNNNKGKEGGTRRLFSIHIETPGTCRIRGERERDCVVKTRRVVKVL
jgi:hypothetical protein